jgi:hypothetical protein
MNQRNVEAFEMWLRPILEDAREKHPNISIRSERTDDGGIELVAGASHRIQRSYVGRETINLMVEGDENIARGIEDFVLELAAVSEMAGPQED